MTVFEDMFSDEQMNMVLAAIEYASGKADDVYLHFSFLGGMLHVGVFYVQAGQTYYRYQLPGVDTSTQRQNLLLDACLKSLMNIYTACKEYDRKMPIEGFFHYKVGGALDARYSYEDIPVGEDPQWDKKLETWMKSVQEELNKKATQR